MKKVIFILVTATIIYACQKQSITPVENLQSSSTKDIQPSVKSLDLTGLIYSRPDLALLATDTTFYGVRGDLYVNRNDRTEFLLESRGPMPPVNNFRMGTYYREIQNGSTVLVSCTGEPKDCWWMANNAEGAKILIPSH